MKEHPIIFSTEMVQAILAGKKSQTRRIIKSDAKYIFWNTVVLNGYAGWADEHGAPIKSRYDVGDLLWVKETHYRFGKWRKNGFTKTGKQKWRFFPDKAFENLRYRDEPPAKVEKNSHRTLGWYWRSSLFMPKAAARIWLEVTDIRVERVQEISEDDAFAEGVEQSRCHFTDGSGSFDSYVGSFADLWVKINGEDSWEQNPWVWVVEFKVLSMDGKKNE